MLFIVQHSGAHPTIHSAQDPQAAERILRRIGINNAHVYQARDRKALDAAYPEYAGAEESVGDDE